MGEIVSFPSNGSTYSGYLAQASEPGPGVIVIQEWWGLVPHIQSVCDRFAAEGVTALAPDFYQGEKADEPELAEKLMMALNIGESEKILRGAVDALLADSTVQGGKVGVVGFCMGGQLSLYAACINPKIGACIDFYGIHPNVNPPIERLEAPVLGFFATKDEYASPSAVSALDQRMNELGKRHEFHTYDAHHAFFNDDRPQVYDPRAANDAWQRSLAFFREHLK